MLSAWKKQVIISICMLYLWQPVIKAQSLDSIQVLEKNLYKNYNAILEADFFNRTKEALAFYESFTEVLNLESSFDYPFDSLKNIGFIYSEDHRLRFITWNIPSGYNDNLYFGIVQYYSRLEKKYRLVRLNDRVNTGREGNTMDWNGALYYSVVETKHAGQRYYTLLGFDLYTPLSNKKLIDVVSLDDYDEFYFCESLINYKDNPQNRLIFEYNEKAIMSLKYNEDLKMIVFDHLSPSRPSLEGQHEFYGPDFTYDGLKWEKGVWIFYSNIDVTN